MPTSSEPILVKHYAQSRLYDTVALRYLALADLKDWRRRGIAFVVWEAETGADITRLLMAELR